MITGIIIGIFIITVLDFILYIVFGIGKLLLKLIEPVFWGIIKTLWWIADTIEEQIDKLKEYIKNHLYFTV